MSFLPEVRLQPARTFRAFLFGSRCSAASSARSERRRFSTSSGERDGETSSPPASRGNPGVSENAPDAGPPTASPSAGSGCEDKIPAPIQGGE